MEEIWKDIIGYEGLYQVSNYGRIKSLSRVMTFGRRNAKRLLDEVIKSTKIKKGYVYVKLAKSGVVTTYLVHRLVAQAFLEPVVDKDQVNHLDFDGTNNRVGNLEWTTRSENQLHSVVHGRGAYAKSKRAIWGRTQ